MQDTRIIGIDYSKDQGLNSYKAKQQLKKQLKQMKRRSGEEFPEKQIIVTLDITANLHFCNITFATRVQGHLHKDMNYVIFL